MNRGDWEHESDGQTLEEYREKYAKPTPAPTPDELIERIVAKYADKKWNLWHTWDSFAEVIRAALREYEEERSKR